MAGRPTRRERKQALRRRILAARQAQVGKAELSARICTRLTTLPEYRRARVVLWYLDCRSELRTRETVARELARISHPASTARAHALSAPRAHGGLDRMSCGPMRPHGVKAGHSAAEKCLVPAAGEQPGPGARRPEGRRGTQGPGLDRPRGPAHRPGHSGSRTGTAGALAPPPAHGPDSPPQGPRLIAIPYVVGNELRLWRLGGMDELAPGRFGILEPAPGLRGDPRRDIPPHRVDLVVVPGVAFDPQGNRLGSGFGFYDRLLARVRADTHLVAPCFQCQVVSCVPAEPHDIRVHQVITERHSYPEPPH